jgi:NAD(P)-dependent dehydrogenase (short-subunit alcohol dehydrogenase family)
MDQPQVVLVTGTSSGFGRLTAQTLARRGHRVFASMRDIRGKNAAAADGLGQLARQEKLPLEVVELDVRDEASVEAAVAGVIAAAGRIDVVVNNAGVGCLGITEAFTPAQVQALFDTNVFGVVRLNRAVLLHMRRQGAGLLVHVTSAAGRILFPLLGPYCATKFALEALAEAYHHDLALLGIDSVIVEPGVYPTDVGKNGMPPADRPRLDEYGEARQKGARLVEAFGNYLGRPDAPQAQEVADVIAELVALPAGRRPLRTLVGPDARRLERLNEAVAQAQRDMLSWLGMDWLLAGGK